jgi:hypothetical protein
MPDRKQLEDLTKELKKNSDSLSGVDASFSSFSDEFKVYVDSQQNITDGLGNFLDMRQDSLAGFGKDLTASFRATQKWADRIKFDIATFADENIRDVNEGIQAFEEMQSETGKSFENRMGGLMEKLRTADQGEATAILQQIHAMREEAHKSLSLEEAERLDFMAKTAQRGLDSIASNTGILKGAIMETLPSLDKFAESVLGGGILGKFAGSVIRKKKAAREAQATAKGMAASGGQQDAANAAATSAGANASEGGVDLAMQMSQQAIVGELREHTKHFKNLLGIEDKQLEQQRKQADGVLDSKESEGEALATDERQHDETVAALKAGGGGEDDGDCPRIPGGFMDAVLGALSGKWIAQAATFLMTPLKKVVGVVAGGVGKAVGFLVPKKWTSGLSKFFKSSDKAQATSIGKTGKSAGFLKGIVDKFKGIIKSLIDTIKTVFKSIGDVINTIAKSIGKVMKTIGRGIASIMKGIAKGVGYFGKKSVILGAVALGIVAGGLWLFSKAMVEFTKVSWKAVGVAAVSILLLVGTLVLLGALMMSGVGAVALLLGAAALVIVAGAMFVLGKAMQEFGKAAKYFMPVFKLIGEVLVRLAKVAMPLFMKVAEGFSEMLSKFGDAILAVVTGVKEVLLGLITSVAPIIDSLTNLIVKPIEAIGNVLVNIMNAIGDIIVKVFDKAYESMDKFGAAGLASRLGKTALAITALGISLGGFAAAKGAGSFIGSSLKAAGDFIEFVNVFGSAPPSAMELLGFLSSLDTTAMERIPNALRKTGEGLAAFGSVSIDTDAAYEAIGVLEEFADELGHPTVVKGFEALSKINIQTFADGLLSIFEIAKYVKGDGYAVFDAISDMMKMFDHIPEQLIDDKANAFNRLADSLGNVADEMLRLDGVDMTNAGYALQLAQQQNIETKERAWWDIPGRIMDGAMQQQSPQAIIQAPMQISSQNSQHFHGPIVSRNPDTSLNNLLSRRR